MHGSVPSQVSRFRTCYRLYAKFELGAGSSLFQRQIYLVVSVPSCIHVSIELSLGEPLPASIHVILLEGYAPYHGLFLLT